jgi:solute carrier family 6 GABA transporter-like protein 6/8/11/12/13
MDPLPWESCNNDWNSEHCWNGTKLNSSEHMENNQISAPQEFYEYYSINNTINSNYLFLILPFSCSNRLLQMTPGIDNFGTMRWELLACLAVAWVLVYFCLWKGIKSSGKVVYVTATLPYLFIGAFIVRALTLPGSELGLLYFFSPKWETLLEAKVFIRFNICGNLYCIIYTFFLLFTQGLGQRSW